MKVSVTLCIVVACAGMGLPVSAVGADKPETRHLAFVTEYVRELSAIESLRAGAEQELKVGAGVPNAAFSNGVYTSTRMQLELRAQIKMLNSMRLNPPFEEIIPDVTKLYA